MAAVGNIDADPDLAVWSVATSDRIGPGGIKVPACVPFREVNDIEPTFFWQR